MSDSTNPTSREAIRARSPLREVWSIAWPTVITMTSYTVMQFADKLMVGQVSPLDVAAQGNGGIWAFVPIAIGIGVLTVVNTYVSQNLGAGTPENGSKYAWGAIWLSILAWVALLLPVAAMLPWIFSRMHTESVEQVDELIRLETGYGQILLLGGVITLLARAMHHYFFGLHRPKVITVSALSANGANILLNYVLIFGAAGLTLRDGAGEVILSLPGVPGVPAMGLFGAAWGTVIATSLEIFIPMSIFLGPKLNAELGTRAAWRPRWRPMHNLLAIGWPAATQYGNELVCWAIFMVTLVGMFGTDHMTAGWIALGYMHLSFMPALGFSVAATSLVGKYIGAGQPDVAVSRARLCLGLAMIYMTVCAVLFFIFRHHLVGAFIGGDVSPEQEQNIIRIGGENLMICAALFQTVDAIGIVYTGALRGAGDTVFPGVVIMILSWVFIVGGGWVLAKYAPGLESIGPWIGASVYIILVGLTMAWRFESGRWRSISLLSNIPEIAILGPGPPATDPDASVQDIVEEIGAG